MAERVRNIVLERGAETVTPITETLLMFAARGIHLETLIRPALARGEWVVCDRFTDATRAYQAGGRGVSRTLIDELARAVHPTLAPDCTLLLDLPVEVGLARSKMRSGNIPRDRFEAEPAVFFERVRAAYLELARQEPKRFTMARSPDDAAAQRPCCRAAHACAAYSRRARRGRQCARVVGGAAGVVHRCAPRALRRLSCLPTR